MPKVMNLGRILTQTAARWPDRSSKVEVVEPAVSTPAGAGKIHIFPSVRTPSTSNRMSLIFLARSLDIGEILAFEVPGRTQIRKHKRSASALPHHKAVAGKPGSRYDSA